MRYARYLRTVLYGVLYCTYSSQSQCVTDARSIHPRTGRVQSVPGTYIHQDRKKAAVELTVTQPRTSDALGARQGHEAEGDILIHE